MLADSSPTGTDLPILAETSGKNAIIVTPHAEHEAELPPIDSSQLDFEEIARNIEAGKKLLETKGASDG